MSFKKQYSDYFFSFSAIFFMGLIISAPKVCAEGAQKGLMLCSGALIPALFPFAVPVLFLINTSAFKRINKKCLALFLLSLIGGYPIGAKLICELCKRNQLSKETARKILPFYINAGPAFIIVAVGKGLLGSVMLGYILFASHIASSVIISAALIPHYILSNNQNKLPNKSLSLSDNFVLSIKGATDACISICAFVMFFSVVNEYVLHFSQGFKPLSILLYFTEVTSAVKQSGNIYVISFLLGFSGISIWMQVLFVSENIKPNIAVFSAVRIIHGLLSVLITTAIIRIFKISVPTFSNNTTLQSKFTYSSLALSFSLLIMVIVLLINIVSKKHSGNIIKDMI